MSKYAAVILAAGKGTRMNEGQSSPIPKVMFKIHNRPMIEYSIENIKNAGIEKIVLVVGYKKEMVMEDIGSSVEYAVQEEQLGTGHAVKMARSILEGKTEAVLVSYGDMPMYRVETIKKVIDLYDKEKPTIAMLTVLTDDPIIDDFSRVIRGANGDVLATVECKDCTEEQLTICEKNPSLYIFNSEWLWHNLEKISTENSQKEYYLPDLIGIACEQGKRIVAHATEDVTEALGINNQEQLKKVEEILAK